MAGVNVQLLIFSGKPDPTYTLDAIETQGLSVRVATSLAAAQVQAMPDGGLGYRGFLIRADIGALLPTASMAFRGVLAVQGDVGELSVRDVGGCEDFLLTTARQRGFGNILDQFGALGGVV